jgi:succinate dehydrogenase flavin-adding protein (antitoxin of CptAB toxin-antitoxin module)
MQMELTDEEADRLRELLERTDADLREEIYKTEGTDWKRALKAREAVLARLLTKVGRASRHGGQRAMSDT